MHRTVIIAAAPLVFFAALAYHPHLMILPDPEAVARAVQADTSRWAIAHWGVGIAMALMAAAFIAVGEYLRDAGEKRWSAMAVPLLVFSMCAYAILPGMEFTVLAAALTGGDVVAAQSAVDSWFKTTLLISGVTNGVGTVLLARAIATSGALAARARNVVIVALSVMAVSRLVPIGPVHMYVQGLASILALWPIAFDVVRRGANVHTREVESVLA